MQGFQLFDILIDMIVLTFDFGHILAIEKMVIFDKVDYFEI